MKDLVKRMGPSGLFECYRIHLPQVAVRRFRGNVAKLLRTGAAFRAIYLHSFIGPHIGSDLALRSFGRVCTYRGAGKSK